MTQSHAVGNRRVELLIVVECLRPKRLSVASFGFVGRVLLELPPYTKVSRSYLA